MMFPRWEFDQSMAISVFPSLEEARNDIFLHSHIVYREALFTVFIFVTLDWEAHGTRLLIREKEKLTSSCGALGQLPDPFDEWKQSSYLFSKLENYTQKKNRKTIAH